MKTKHIAVTLEFPSVFNKVVAVEYEGQDDEAMDNLFLMCAIHEALNTTIEAVYTGLVTSEFMVIDSDIAEELGEYEWGPHENLPFAIESVLEDKERAND